MVFPSIPPAYLDPPNWQPLQQVNQQESIHGGLAGRPPRDHQQEAHEVLVVQGGGAGHGTAGGARGGYGGGGGGSTISRPGSMAERARMENIPMPEAALKCPRCESTNTKFCYFNNYSLTQPRHFCKTCRRYWTRGGALRNVPVGGGCRRNKRSSSTKSSSGNSNNNGTTTSSSKSSPGRANTQIMAQAGLFGGGGSSTPANTSSSTMMNMINSNTNNISPNILGLSSAAQIPQLRFMGHHHNALVESPVLVPHHHDYNIGTGYGGGAGLHINSSLADPVSSTTSAAHQMNMNFNNLFGTGSSSDSGSPAASVFNYPFHGQLLMGGMDQSAGHGGGMLYPSGGYNNNHDQQGAAGNNAIEPGGAYHGSYGSAGAKVLVSSTTTMISDQLASVKVEDRHPNVNTSMKLSNNIGNYNNRQGQLLEQDEDRSTTTTTTRQLMGTGVVSTNQDREWSNGSAAAAWTDLSG